MQGSLAERSAEDLVARHRGMRRYVVDGIVVLNVLIFAAWQVGARVPELGGVMERNFLVSLSRLEAGRIWTLLTSVFSHAALLHLAINMLVFKSFAPPIVRAWGLRHFVTFYLCAGIAASAAHATFTWFGWPDMPALGASGAVAGMLIAYAFLFPRRLVYLFALVPLPAWLMAVAFVGFDLWGLVSQYQNRELPLEGQVLIGHGAHLGGALFGVIWSLADRSRFDDLLAQEQEALDAADEDEAARLRRYQQERMAQRLGQARRTRPGWLSGGEDDAT
jgi:rhomboid-like protein